MTSAEAELAVRSRLSLTGVTKTFGGVHALQGVSFDVAPGQIHALVGENGAGKSTLVSIITGLRHADAGRVELDGARVSFDTPRDARAAGISAVYQDPNLFPHLSVAENIFTGRYPITGGVVDKREMNRRATELLDTLGVDIDVEGAVAGLSVAEAQFVEIARAISGSLKLLILDEPTSALTPTEAAKLFTIVRRLRDEGTSVIWISHRMEEIHDLSDTITVLRDGSHVRTAPAAELTTDEMIRLMVGRSVVLERVVRTQPLGSVRLAVGGLSLPGVFEDISFEVREGEILGFAGLVGAGRSEIMQAIAGLTQQPTGRVELLGEAVVPRSARAMISQGLVYLPEDRDGEAILSEMTVLQNIALPSTDRLKRRGLVSRSAERQLATEQVQTLQIKAQVDDPVRALSGGNRQKVAIGRILSTSPQVLILDEPTHGIDIGTKEQVHTIIRNLAREARMAVVVVSSDLPELLAISDRIIVIRKGRISTEFDAADATPERVLAAATATLTGALT